MDTKKCNSCGIEKHKTEDFPKNGRIYRAICKKCHSAKQIERYNQNRKVHLEKNYEENRIQILEAGKQYRKENRDAEQKTEYYSANRDEILQKSKTKDYKEKRNKYLRDRRKNDKFFAMISSYRCRLHEVLHKQKKNSYISYLRCKREQFLDWLEFQFDDKFVWETYGKTWVIDHVIPNDFFNLDDEKHVERCFAWYNLRPCDTKENMNKSNTIILDVVESHQNVINNFTKINNWYQADVEIYQWLREQLGYGKNPSVLGNPQPSS
uniref:Uncharacterized protein n=1 Tax=viral metagenome TaxID=1070528 RepID=A0A6C0DZP5_9ZZZZ